MQREPDVVTYWMGQRVEDMSKDELIGALKIMVRREQSAHDMHMSTLDMWKLCRERRYAA